MKPTVGRIVHFLYWGAPPDHEPHAAIVTSVRCYRAGWMLLSVFTRNPHAPIENVEVPLVGGHEGDGARGRWFWPERAR